MEQKCLAKGNEDAEIMSSDGKSYLYIAVL